MTAPIPIIRAEARATGVSSSAAGSTRGSSWPRRRTARSSCSKTRWRRARRLRCTSTPTPTRPSTCSTASSTSTSPVTGAASVRRGLVRAEGRPARAPRRLRRGAAAHLADAGYRPGVLPRRAVSRRPATRPTWSTSHACRHPRRRTGECRSSVRRRSTPTMSPDAGARVRSGHFVSPRIRTAPNMISVDGGRDDDRKPNDARPKRYSNGS